MEKLRADDIVTEITFHFRPACMQSVHCMNYMHVHKKMM